MDLEREVAWHGPIEHAARELCRLNPGDEACQRYLENESRVLAEMKRQLRAIKEKSAGKPA